MEMVNVSNDIMTISEVAEYLKISEMTTYKMVQNGTIPGFKIGRGWRIKRADLVIFIEAQKKGEKF